MKSIHFLKFLRTQGSKSWTLFSFKRTYPIFRHALPMSKFNHFLTRGRVKYAMREKKEETNRKATPAVEGNNSQWR